MLPALLSGLALICQGQLAPPAPAEQREERLRGYMEMRAEFGFRSDRAYVLRLIRRGLWESDVGFIPATPAEDRYLRRRDRLEVSAPVRRYLRWRPGLSGGVSIEDGWPRRAYLLVRVTRRPAHHQRVLRRLSSDPLRVVRVARSERSLRRLQRRVSFRAHERDGFNVVSTSVDIDRSRVVIGLITRRTDHAAYFRTRYGPWVRTVVIATEPTSLECTEASAYQPVDGGLVVHWVTGGGAELDRVEVTEFPDRVEIGVVERVPNGFRTSEARAARHRVALATPLGDRRVVDAATGRRLRRGSTAFGA